MGRKVVAGVVMLGLLGGGAVVVLWDSMPWADKRECATPSTVVRTDLAPSEDTSSYPYAMLSPDGRHMLWPDYEPALVDVTTGKTVRRYDGNVPEVVSFRADGSSFVTLQRFKSTVDQVYAAAVWPVDGDKALQMFPQYQPQPNKKEEDRFLRDTAISPDGKVAALGTSDGLVRVWDVKTRALRATMEEKSDLHDLARYQSSRLTFSPDGKLVALGDGVGEVRVWDTRTGKVEHRFTAPGYSAIQLSFSPDGKYLAVREHGREWPAEQHDVWVVEIATKRSIQVVSYRRKIVAMRFSPDSSTIVTANWRGEIDRTTLADGKTTTVLHVCRAEHLMVTPDAKSVLFLARSADRARYEVRTVTLP